MPTVASWIDELKRNADENSEDDDDSEDEDWVPTEDNKSSNSDSHDVIDAKSSEPVEIIEAKQEDDRKRKADLWSSFLKDVKGPKPKVAKISTTCKPDSELKITQTVSCKTQESSFDSTNEPKTELESTEEGDEKSNAKSSEKSSPSKATISSEWVEIKRVYDFAGEEIVVTEKVASTSKEANQTNSAAENGGQSTHTSDGNSSNRLKDEEPVSASSSLTNPSTAGIDSRPATVKVGIEGSRLGSIVGSLGKKKKMGTLQKSALDWESFKSQQGEHLTEELNAHRRSKGSFLDRQDFLQRVDWAQFEIERDARSKERKRTGQNI